MHKFVKYGIMGVIAVTLSAVFFHSQPDHMASPSPRNYQQDKNTDSRRKDTLRQVRGFYKPAYRASFEKRHG